MIEIAIPSSNRVTLLQITTMKLLKKNNINHITIFVPDDQVSTYKSTFPSTDVVGVPMRGIGNTRTFIRKYYDVGTKIIQIDDDIKDICSIDDSFKKLTLMEYFEECFEIMKKEDVKFAGFCPYDNEFYMKEGYTLSPKYTGGHLILEIIREEPIEVSINHFEDYIANALYYIIDRKLLRFNGTYVKTKYFNKNGGIIDYYGGLSKRKEMADKLGEKISLIFKGLLYTTRNKTHDITNLKFPNRYKYTERCIKMMEDYYNNKDTLEMLKTFSP